MHYKLLVIIFIGLLVKGNAQNGGGNTFEFLNVPVSARVGALGGNVIAVKDDDPNLALDNPALLNEQMHSVVNLTYLNYFSDINYGYVSYTHHANKLGTFSGGIKYINYGSFRETDAGGNELGEFTAGEYAFVLGWGKSLDSLFSVGANLKPVYSSLYNYYSFGILMDAGVNYFNPKSNFGAALLVKNAGMQLKTYIEDGEREPVPFEVQAGISKKLKHVPLRFSMDLTNLHDWNLAYNDSTYLTNTDNSLSDEEKDERNQTSFINEALRHVVLGLEVIPTKSFNLRFGFNLKRRSELAVDQKPGLVGFSWGLGFRIKRFHISYGSARYHLAGSSNHFTVTTNITQNYRQAYPKKVKVKKEKPVKIKRRDKTETENE